MNDDKSAALVEEISRVSALVAPISLDEALAWPPVEYTADIDEDLNPSGDHAWSADGLRLIRPAQTEPSSSGWLRPTWSPRVLIVAGAAAAILLVALLWTLFDGGSDENNTIFTDDVDQEREPAVDEEPPPETPGMTGQQAPEAELEDTETIPDTTPLGLVVQTTTPSSLGDIAWTVLEGGPSVVPSGIVETAEGYAAVTDGGGLLVSSDGGSWREVSSPASGELRSLERHGDGYVLDVVGEDGGSQFWETNDFDTWQPGSGPPPQLLDAASGLGVTTRLFAGSSVESQGTTLTFWDVFVRVDWRAIAVQLVDEAQRDKVQALYVVGEIDYTSDVISLQGYVDERDAFGGRDPDESLGQLNFVATETGDRWTVTLNDVSTGEPLGSMEGSLGGTSFEAAFSRLGSGFGEERLALETEAEVEFVDIPWDNPDNGAEFAGTHDGFTAVRRIGDFESPFRMEVWKSSDGRQWQNVALATSDEMGDINSFAEHNGVMIVTFGHTDDVSRYVIWRSEDGITWAPPSVPPEPTWEDFDDGFGNTLHNATGDAYGVPAGWAWLSGGETDFALWTSSDGDVWEQVDANGLPAPFWAQLFEPEVNFGGGGSQWISGNSLFIREDSQVENREQPSRVWVISIPG